MRGAFALLAAIWFIWGYNWTVMKIALRSSGPWEFIALRNVGSAVLMLAILLALRRPLTPKPLLPLLLIGLLQGVGMNGLSMAAVASGGAARATILAFTMPFWTVLFARIILHEEIRLTQWIAIVLGITGLALVLAPHGHSLGSELGDFFGVGAGLCWALGTVVSKWAAKRHEMDPVSVVTWQNIFAVIPVVAIALSAHEVRISWNPVFSATLFYNVVLTGAVAWLIWFYILKILPAVTAGMGALAIPVVGILCAYLQLGERPQPLQWLGSFVILAALAVVTTAAAFPKRESPEAQPA